MKKILLSWIGIADFKASQGNEAVGLGPIAQALTSLEYAEIHLVSDWSEKDNLNYIDWLKAKFNIHNASIHKRRLTSPTQFGEIYKAATSVIQELQNVYKDELSLTFHLSPGTPAMAAVWILISKTRFPAALIESSISGGVKDVSIPFDISAEYIPDLLKNSDSRLEKLMEGLPPSSPEFIQIIHRSEQMERVIAKARYVAPRSVPVLIEGESGTGKEILARAIHGASPRKDKAFITVNCGAIPFSLIESEFFGHEKGAFTGADKKKTGLFEAAEGGTLFLDEVGELPLQAQVKLLRILQEKEISRVGSVKTIKIDVRIIAATNRDLIKEISDGRFRSDLFYRLAVAVLKLPPLRERQGDIGFLIDHLLDRMNQEKDNDLNAKHKKISVEAKNFMLQYSWPGNVRELQNTLLRAAIWSPEEFIGIEDTRDAIIPLNYGDSDSMLGRPVENGIDLQALIDHLCRHYLERAMIAANGNKTKASELLGLPSYQTLSNWLKKYNIE